VGLLGYCGSSIDHGPLKVGKLGLRNYPARKNLESTWQLGECSAKTWYQNSTKKTQTFYETKYKNIFKYGIRELQ